MNQSDWELIEGNSTGYYHKSKWVGTTLPAFEPQGQSWGLSLLRGIRMIHDLGTVSPLKS